jgi:hypothetical protein
VALVAESLRETCCVVVPLYRSWVAEDEALSLILTHARASGKAALIIVHPPEISVFVQRLQAWFKRGYPQAASFLGLEIPGQYFTSVAAYNRLLLADFFYQKLSDYEWMFIVQLDALLLSDQLSSWFDMPYSYIGAPWLIGLDRPIQPLRPLGGGNGGFSLRRIAACREVLRFRGWLYPYFRGLELNTLPDQRWRAEGRACRQFFAHAGRLDRLPIYEDLFWSFVAPLINPSFGVAPFSLSSCFAFETEPRFLFQRTGAVPLGCHAYQRHDPSFWHELWQSRPDLIGPFVDSARRLVVDLCQGS